MSWSWFAQGTPLVISALVAGAQVRRALADRRQERRDVRKNTSDAEVARVKAEAERNAIITTSAETAVAVLERALKKVDDENERLRTRLSTIELREAQMVEDLHTCAAMNKSLEERLERAEHQVRELSDQIERLNGGTAHL